MKKQKGNLTIEASLVLTMFTFFILFFFSFGRVYKAQNIVSHATIQCAESLAVESYFRETVSSTNAGIVARLVTDILGDNQVTDSMLSLSSVDLGSVIRKNFAIAIGDNETEADRILKATGVKGGLEGVKFGNSKVEANDIIVSTTYTVELQFPLFGKKEFTLTKAAKSRAFKKIAYSVKISANNPAYGDVSNSVNASHGEKITISATPKPGHEFVKWDDGNTDAIREITVSGNSNHVAIFKPVSYNIIVNSNNPAYGKTSGSVDADYGTKVTISATPNPGYKFVKWSDGNTSSSREITVSGKSEYTAIFEPNKYTITAKPEKDTYGYTEGSCTADYNSTVVIKAFNKPGYVFKKWSDGNTSAVRSVVVKSNATYVAQYTRMFTITFDANGGKSTVTSLQVESGGKLGYVPSATKNCHVLEGWYTSKNGGSMITAGHSIKSDMTVYARWKESAHAYSETNRTGTRCTGGEITYKCTVCGKVKTETYSASAHNWKEQSRTGTVCTGGTIKYKCSICNDEYSKDYNGTPHKWKEQSRTGTVCKGGNINYKCTVCSDKKTVPYKGKGHDYSYRCNASKPHTYKGQLWIGDCGTHNNKGFYHVVCSRCSNIKANAYWCGEHSAYRKTKKIH